MKKFAVIQDSKVTNVIVAESQKIAEELTGLTCVEYTDENPACIGLSYDGTTFEQHIIEDTAVPPVTE
jgi:hypothetical protein